MENHNILMNEYFELLRLLNKTNKLPDEKTNAYFKIKATNDIPEKNLYFMIDENQKILICRKIQAGFWIAGGYTGRNNLEKAVSRYINTSSIEFLNSIELSVKLRDFIFGNNFTTR